MPLSYIKNLSKKYNISETELENIWNDAKSHVKGNNWGEVTNIFKNMINSKYNINEKAVLNFEEFREIVEEFENQEEIPTKEIQNKNMKDKYNG